jgi:PAS domain S-box-containing protein
MGSGSEGTDLARFHGSFAMSGSRCGIVGLFRFVKPGVARTIVKLFILCGVLPLGLSSMILLLSCFKGQKTAIAQVQKEIAERIATAVSAHLERASGEIQLFTRVIDFGSSDRKRTEALIHDLLEMELAFNIVTVMNRTGDETFKVSRYYTFRSFELVNRASDPSFRKAIAGNVSMEEITVSSFSHFPELPITVPIRDPAGGVVGVMQVGVNVSHLWELISKYRLGAVHNAYIVDSQGLLIAHRDVSAVIEKRDLSGIFGVSRFRVSETGVYQYTGLSGARVMGASALVPLTGWGVVVEQGLHSAYRDLYVLSAVFLGLSGLSVLLTVMLGLRFSFVNIVHPIRRLESEAGAIARGQFSRRVEVGSRSDEIGQLADAFNAMASDLEKTTVSRDLLLSEITERKRAEEALKLEESRLEALLRINRMSRASLDEITDYALEEAVRLTQSSIGYVAFLDRDETMLTIYGWSMSVVEGCGIGDQRTVFHVEETGLWGEAVRQRRPIITNDYRAENPQKKGLPEGHVPLQRHMSVPVLDGDRIVVLVGVANKATDYDQSDVRQLNLLMTGMWHIIKRRLDEMALRDSENKLRSIIEHSDNLFYSHNTNHVLTYVSPQTRHFFDCEPGEALVRWMEFATEHPINTIAMERVQTAIETGERQPPYEMELIGKLGRKIWVEVNESPVVEDGRTAAVVGALTDITHRKAAEFALRESEEKYRTVVGETRDGIFLVDFHSLRILEANQAVLGMLGETHQRIVGLDFRNLIVGDSGELHGRMCRSLGERSHFLGELELKGRDGRCLDMEVSANIVSYGGRKTLCLVVRDITERKRLEQELFRAQKIESLGVLAGGIAHDFNNILTAVIGNISLARVLVTEEEEAVKRLEETEKACFRARDLTQQLLTFARGGAPIKRSVSIARLIEETAVFALRGSKVRCVFEIEKDLARVEVDEGQISQVIHNLVINAQQAMPEGGTIVVKAENVPMESDQASIHGPETRVRISIRDVGAGIPPEQITRIFDPYFTTKKTGSGLGLAVAYSIMKGHGGRITVDSEPGKGSTFQLELPAAAGCSRATESAAAMSPSAVSGLRVLVMDDEQMVRDVLGALLRNLGCEVTLAGEGDAAIEMYRMAQAGGLTFDAVILDLTVPGGMGGKEALRHLQKLDPHVRAIVSSGYSNDPVMAEYGEYGFSGVVCKPFNMHQLQEVLKDSVHRNSAVSLEPVCREGAISLICR